MNSRKLREAGVPPEHLGLAVQAVQALAERNRSLPKEARVKPEELLREVMDRPRVAAASSRVVGADAILTEQALGFIEFIASDCSD